MNLNVVLDEESNDINVDLESIYTPTPSPVIVTPNRAVASNANGSLTASATTATELSYLSGARSNLQNQIDNISPVGTFTPNTALIADNEGVISSSGITSTELGYLDGVRSNIQLQIDNISPAETFTPNTALVTNTEGKIISSSVSSTEIAYLNGTSGNVQVQINGKQDRLAAQTSYSAKGSSTKVPQITTNRLGQVTEITEVDIMAGAIDDVLVNGTSVVEDKVADVPVPVEYVQSFAPTSPKDGDIWVDISETKLLHITDSGETVKWENVKNKPFSSIDPHTLKVEDAVLKVNTADDMLGDNTRPMTAAGVSAIVGNINVLLEGI